MNPAPEAPGCNQDDTAALRRQLILAQVQLMELEDARDDLRTRFAEAQALLAAAQRQADSALQEHDQIARRIETLQQESHGQRVALAGANERIQGLAAALAQSQQVADQALQARLQLEQQHQALLAEAAGLRDRLGASQAEVATLAAQVAERQTALVSRDDQLREAHRLLAERDTRIAQLEAERRALKASRSWRYTAPLRAMERLLQRLGGPRG